MQVLENLSYKGTAFMFKRFEVLKKWMWTNLWIWYHTKERLGANISTQCIKLLPANLASLCVPVQVAVLKLWSTLCWCSQQGSRRWPTSLIPCHPLGSSSLLASALVILILWSLEEWTSAVDERFVSLGISPSLCSFVQIIS